MLFLYLILIATSYADGEQYLIELTGIIVVENKRLRILVFTRFLIKFIRILVILIRILIDLTRILDRSSSIRIPVNSIKYFFPCSMIKQCY